MILVYVSVSDMEKLTGSAGVQMCDSESTPDVLVVTGVNMLICNKCVKT